MGEHKHRTTRKQKERNNFDRQIAIMDNYDTYYGDYRSTADDEILKINYDLMNGRLDTSMYDVEEYCEIQGEKVTLKSGEIPHNPVTALLTKILRGEFMQRPFELTVEDISTYKNTVGREAYAATLRDAVNAAVVQPLMQRASQEVLVEAGIVDPSQLNEEQAMAVQQAAAQRLDSLLGKGLKGFMEEDFISPMATQGQEILNHLERKLDLREKQIEGFTHSIPSNAAFYYVNIGTNGPEFEMVPKLELTFGGPVGTEWVQEMDWVRRERFETISSITQKYSEYLNPSHWKELERNLEPIPNSHVSAKTIQEGRYMMEIANDGKEIVRRFGSQDGRLKENFINIASAMEYANMKYRGQYSLSELGIRVCHFVWKDKRKLYKVWQQVGDEVKSFYFGENYKPVSSDLKVEEIWVNEVWEGTKIGTENPIYINIKPIDWQWSSLRNPHEVELPYVGKMFDTMRGIVKNVSMIDLAKQYNRDYDTQMALLRRDIRTNTGKVFLMFLDMKPDNITWQSFLDNIRDFNIAILDNKKRGATPYDANAIRSIDMSKISDIQARLMLINDILRKLYNILGFNEFRAAGQASQYANTTNIIAQQQGAYNQTEPFFEANRVVFEKAINKLLNAARYYYKENPEELEFVLTTPSMAELKYGYPFWYSELNVYVENSGKIARQVEFLRQQVHAFIQNSVNPSDVIKMAMADNKSDLIDLMKSIEKRAMEDQAAAAQQAREQFEQELQFQAQQKQQEREFEYKLHQERLASQEAREEVRSEVFRKANDVNNNQQHDLREMKELEMEADYRKFREKMELEWAKLREKR